MMRTKNLAFVAFVLTGAVGNDKCGKWSIAEAREAIKAGTVFSFLEKGDLRIDVSAISHKTQVEVLEVWRNLADAYIDNKLCRTDDGFALLLAYTTNAIMHQADEDEKKLKTCQKKLQAGDDKDKGITRL